MSPRTVSPRTVSPRTLAGLLGPVLLAACEAGAAPPPAPAAPEDLSLTPLQSVADRPWWSPRVPTGATLPGSTGLTARDCGMCHAEIYAEWQTSTHAAAWIDPQFQVELAKDPPVAWICINCHTPAGDQQAVGIDWTPADGVREVGRSRNDRYQPVWQQEGITCVSCHWRDGAMAAPHADVQAPHPTVYAPDLAGADLCLGCHQATARVEDALICHFTTGEEWQTANQDKACPECHMPQVSRAVAPGAPVRATRRHTWPGSLIPKSDPPPPGFDAVAASWQPGVEAHIEAPARARPGERVHAQLVVQNVRAGHRVPTGDPERYLLLTGRVQALSAATSSTATSSTAPAAASATADPPVIAGARARIGQRWLWWPVARQLDDDRIPPGEARTVDLEFVMPQGPARIDLSLEHYRISPENASYHGLIGYPGHRLVQALSATVLPSLPADLPPR